MPPEGEVSPQRKNKTPYWVAILVFLVLLLGAYFRFTGIEWDDNGKPMPIIGGKVWDEMPPELASIRARNGGA